MESLSLFAKATMAVITVRVPTMAVKPMVQLPSVYTEMPIEAASMVTQATARLAPELMPRTYGPANGFLKTICIMAPDTERAAPVKMAASALGNLMSNSIAVLFVVCPFK